MVTRPIVGIPRPPRMRAPRPLEVLITARRGRRRTNATVMLGDEHLGQTPLYLSRQPGVYLVTARMPGVPAVKVEVLVSEARGRHVEIALGLDPVH